MRKRLLDFFECDERGEVWEMRLVFDPLSSQNISPVDAFRFRRTFASGVVAQHFARISDPERFFAIHWQAQL